MSVSLRARRVVLAAAVALAAAGVSAAAAAPAAAAPESTGFSPVDPIREVDTRLGRGGDRLLAGVERFVVLPSVPLHAEAVTINVTVVDAAGDGFLTVTDCRPGAGSSAVNFVGGRVTPNQVHVGVVGDSFRGVCLTASRDAHVVIDLFGFTADAGSASFVPASGREHDTRAEGGIRGDGVLVVDVGHHAAHPKTPRPVVAWSGTVTVTDVGSTGFVTVYACAAGRPGVSNLNLVPGVTKANQVTVRLPADDPRVCLYREGQAQLVVDTTGVWRDDHAQTFTPASPPTRTIDTRSGDQVRPDEIRRLHAPADAVLFLNVTATRARGDGWVALFPCGAGYQGTSTLNVIHGEDVSSAAIVGAADGGVCVTTSVATDVVIDVFGVQHPTGSASGVAAGVPLDGTTVAPGRSDDPGAAYIGPCIPGPLDALDRARASVGQPALVSDARTAVFACEWATVLATAGEMYHSTPDQRSGIDECGVNGENIAAGGSDWAWMPGAWLASTTHYGVIVHPLLIRASVVYVERTVGDSTTWFGVAAFGGSC